MLSGIYLIKNIVNNKIYIGSAINISSRWSSHKSKLNSNKHANKHLQNSWNKHKESNFDFMILEYCQISDLIKTEQYYLDCLNPQFNICKNANSRLGTKYNIESIKKLSDAKKLFYKNNPNAQKNENNNMYGKIGKLNKKSKPIFQYSENKELIQEWESLSQLCKCLKLTKSVISIACNKNIKKYNYIWSFKKIDKSF